MSEENSASAPKKPELTKKELAQQLWERLARSRPGPDNKDLIFIARFVPALSSGAVKTLLTRSLTIAELRELIHHVPKAREGVAKVVLEMNPKDLSEEDLKYFFTETKSPELGRALLKRFPLDQNLSVVENAVESLKDMVEKIRKQETTREVLREIERKL